MPTGLAAAAPAALLPVLIAAIGAQRVLIPSSAVVEVSRPATLTRVPGLPGWILGLTNARGQVLAVLDIRSLLDPEGDSGSARAITAAEQGERSAARPRLLIVESGPIRVGVLVDAVEGVAELPGDECEPLPMGVTGGGLLRGMVTVGAAPAVLLDPAALVALRNQLAC
jgi:purine-binding chemotaxis protein CheW